jgi:hypothetical protein
MRAAAFEAWAPDESPWARWVKPVLFAAEMNYNTPEIKDIPEADWAPPPGRTAFILDLPGDEGVRQGLALAKAGDRPVPLYNGVFSSAGGDMAVDVTGIVRALFGGAETLRQAGLRPHAPPAFLLDADRMKGEPRPKGKYDNRWCVFPQDMPSAGFLREQGIREVCLRSSLRQNDLMHILLRYKQAGLRITRWIPGEAAAADLALVRPSLFRSFIYRARVMAGLTRNAAGGFGGSIPEPMQAGGNGGGYYRFG